MSHAQSHEYNKDDQHEQEELLKEQLVFLDTLRTSGKINMFHARPYLMSAFDLDGAEATKIMLYWMDTFNLRHQGDK